MNDASVILAKWPAALEARWRVLSWPNWRGKGDLASIKSEFGASLAKQNACLCLHHDPETDGPIDRATSRVQKVFGLTDGTGQIRVAIIEGPLSDHAWQEIGSVMDGKISRPAMPDSPQRKRIDAMHLFELRTGRDVERLLVAQPTVTPLDHYRRLFGAVPGWFGPTASDIWDSLLSFQSSAGVRGNFLEIGVWMGRSALLSTLHASGVEECIFVDPLPIAQARESLLSVKKSGLHFVTGTSRSLSSAMLPDSARLGYRWIHIDGEHTGIAVEHDLALASSVLGKRGIIVIDDFFAPAYPQITFAVIEYLQAHRRSLMMFLCGLNKGYLCHPTDGPWLLRHCAERMTPDLEERGAPPLTLFKTTDPLDLNCFGIAPRGVKKAFRGPDWDEDLIKY